MKTWQSYSGNSGAATTTWTYNDYRNWLAKKQDNAGKGPEYEYTPGGKLKTRKWARNITTTYNYGTATSGNSGDLVSIDYSDTTPDVTYTYDRLGRVKTAARNGMTDTLSYNTASEQVSEVFSGTGATLAGFSVVNGYDSQLRRSSTETKYGSTALAHFDYGYDATTGRFQSANYGTAGAVYAYEPNSSLVSQISFANNGTTRLATTKQFDRINRTISAKCGKRG